MCMRIDCDPITNRWYVCLPDEPGRPRIEADTPEQLEAFLNDVQMGMFHRERKAEAA